MKQIYIYGPNEKLVHDKWRTDFFQGNIKEAEKNKGYYDIWNDVGFEYLYDSNNQTIWIFAENLKDAQNQIAKLKKFRKEYRKKYWKYYL